MFLNKSNFLMQRLQFLVLLFSKRVMIEKLQHDNTNLHQHDHLSLELIQYKKLNANLKKKIKARDRQINYLFNCIDQIAKPSPSNPQSSNIWARNLSENNHKNEIFTDIKKKEKENVNFLNHGQNSIFKQGSSRNMAKLGKQQVRLPSLEKKNVFHDEHSSYAMDQSLPRQRVIKVSADRLVPLKPQEVKKKYQMKFKKDP